MEDDHANLAELYQQAQEEKAAFLELNQNLQRKLSDYLRTVKKNEVPSDHRPPHPPPIPAPHTALTHSSRPPPPPHLPLLSPLPSPTQENKEAQEKSVTDQEQRYFKCLAQVNELRHSPHPHPHPHHSPSP